jgi:hypothetical protein
MVTQFYVSPAKRRVFRCKNHTPVVIDVVVLFNSVSRKWAIQRASERLNKWWIVRQSSLQPLL